LKLNVHGIFVCYQSLTINQRFSHSIFFPRAIPRFNQVFRRKKFPRSRIGQTVAVNLSKKGKERDIDPKDLDRLAKYFRKKIKEELRKDYQIVESPGSDVIRIRTSISEVDKTLPYLNIHPGTKIMGGGLGGAGGEMELVDSVTGERISAAIDNQKGSRLSIGAGLTWYGHAEEVMENWAKDLKKMVDRAYRKSTK